jgi:hypothetical protein
LPLEQHLEIEKKNIVWFLQVMVVGGVNLFSKFQMLCHLLASHEGFSSKWRNHWFFFQKFSCCSKSGNEAQDDLAKSSYKTNRQTENLGILLQTIS